MCSLGKGEEIGEAAGAQGAIWGSKGSGVGKGLFAAGCKEQVGSAWFACVWVWAGGRWLGEGGTGKSELLGFGK